MKKRVLAVILLVTITVVGCGKANEKTVSKEPSNKGKKVEKEIAAEINTVSGKEDEGAQEESVTEVVEENATETVSTEPAQTKKEQKTENKKTEQKKVQTETPVVTTPVVSETAVSTPEPEVKVEECTHWYQPVETKNCASIKKMVWSCNGCGYALFDISSTDYSPINFPNMYVHPPCETDRFDEPCCGGGYHSEAYYYWEGCYECHSPIILRSCTTFYVMAERCIQNESNFGPYEKVETGHAYIKSCDCGKNLMVSGDEGGMMLFKEQCCYCGDVKTYPQK